MNDEDWDVYCKDLRNRAQVYLNFENTVQDAARIIRLGKVWTAPPTTATAFLPTYEELLARWTEIGGPCQN